jgi:uncharacterized membrane protein
MSTRDRSIKMRTLRVFGIPALLAVTSGAGLVSALVGDGVWDTLSWFALSAPLVVIACFVWLAVGWQVIGRQGATLRK